MRVTSAARRVLGGRARRHLAGLEALGATIMEPRDGTRAWTVMADPEGNEFCAFTQ